MTNNIIYFFLIFIFLFQFSFSFIALPFSTIFIKNDSITPKNDYRAIMLQNELYVNISLGNPIQNVTSILRMDLYGFLIYNGSFNRNISKTYEEIKKEMRLTCILQVKAICSKDYFRFPSFSSYNDFNEYLQTKNDKKLLENIKNEKSDFLWIRKNRDSINIFNDIYENYGIIGLKLDFNKYFHAPEFVTTFKDIKKHTFYLKFNEDKINGFVNSNNTGYFIVGEELTDNINEKKYIRYTKARERLSQINWDLAFDDIISKSTENETIEYRPEYKHAELYVNFPYILGTRVYEAFIKKVFFQELLIKKACNYIYNINGEEYSGFKCDSKSDIFIENLNKKFPDLIFEHKELGEKFLLTKKDLFTYNMYNKSDTYVYFLILFPEIKDKFYPMSWILGIPFFKKYILSFNYDNKMIGYYKKGNNTLNNSFFYLHKKEMVISMVFFFVIILSFFLGMLTQKKISKNQRKEKAYELNDNFEYNEKSSNNNNSGANKEIELSSKLIN